jgi:hypothetical protein
VEDRSVFAAAVDELFVASMARKLGELFDEVAELAGEEHESCLRLIGQGLCRVVVDRWEPESARAAVSAVVNGLLQGIRNESRRAAPACSGPVTTDKGDADPKMDDA